MRNELSDDVVKIRRYCAGDTPFLFEAARESIKEMSVWLSWCHANYSLEDSRAFISSCNSAWDEKSGFAFAVFDVKSGLFLGGVGVNQINHAHNFANLGYWVRSSQTGRGVATATALLAAEFGFTDLGLNRIEILAAIENLASQRVAEKAGAQREGVLRNRLLIRKRPHDAVMYSLICNNRNKQAISL